MFTPYGSSSIMTRIATSLKVGAMLVLLGLLVVATERPMLLSPPSAVSAAEARAHARAIATGQKHETQSGDATAASGDSPSQLPAPTGSVEDLPPPL